MEHLITQKQRVILVEPDDFMREKLADTLGRAGLADACDIVAEADDGVEGAQISLRDLGVLRAGALLDRIVSLQKSAQSAAHLKIGSSYTLDLAQSVLKSESGPDIRLTEKETALLEILHQAQAGAVPRDVLLEQVWDYAESVETHTLETHIYRLRQKIEKDPSDPQILLTDEAGYRLVSE